MDSLEEVEHDEPIEKPKPKRQGKNTGENFVMTPARKDALERANAKRKELAEARKNERLAKEEDDRKILESKVIAKAIAIKKRQLKKEAVIDSIPEIPLRKAVAIQSKYKYY